MRPAATKLNAHRLSRALREDTCCEPRYFIEGGYSSGDLRQLARQTKDADQACRLLALAMIYDGGSRADAAKLGSVTLQVVRDWVVRFNARGPDGLINRRAPGY